MHQSMMVTANNFTVPWDNLQNENYFKQRRIWKKVDNAPLRKCLKTRKSFQILNTLSQPLSVLGVWISPHYMLVQTHEEITTSSTTGLNRLLTVGGKKKWAYRVKTVFEEKSMYDAAFQNY